MGGKGKGSNDDKTQTPCKFVPLPHLQSIRIEASSADNDRYADEKNYRTKQFRLTRVQNVVIAIGAGVSLFSLLAVFYGLFLNRIATNAAVAQVENSAHQFELAQRPWVSSTPALSSDFKFNAGGATLSLTFHLHNSGITPAENVFAFAQFQPLVGNPESRSRQKEATCDIAKNFSADSQDIIFPNRDAEQRRTVALGRNFINSWGKPNSGYLPIDIVTCTVYRSDLAKDPYFFVQVYSIEEIIPGDTTGTFMGITIGKDVSVETSAWSPCSLIHTCLPIHRGAANTKYWGSSLRSE